MSYFLEHVLVFLFVTISDILWTLFIRAVHEDKVMLASIVSTFIILLTAGTAISYISDHWKLIPAALGAFVGTFITMKYIKKK